MFSKAPLQQTDLHNGLEEQIKNTIRPGNFYKFKEAVDALGDRYKALEEAVPKIQDG